ncbi:MAG TPA: Calx-beta domain-containing protein, partial [Quisquiliibacterium sp.]|nr:Calx-beta domain-containing protein [Quisquiliibacterium sp.]
MLYLDVDSVTVSESDGFADLVLRLNAPANAAFTVNYTTAQGTASYANNVGNDFLYTNGSLVFAPGELTKTVKIPITENAVAEGVENFWLQLGLPSASVPLVTLVRSEVSVFIVDNDASLGGTPVVSVADVAVDESTSEVARFVFTLDRPASGTTSVQYQAVAGTALAGQDFTAITGTVTFAAGDTAQVVEVPLLDDAQAEGAEQFTLQLGAATGLMLGTPQAVATIGANDGVAMPRPVLYVDDVTVSEADGVATMVLRLDAPSNSAITINYVNAQGTASYANNVSNDFQYGGATVVFAPGQTVHTVQIPITNDSATEEQENFWLVLSVPAASQTLVTLSRAEIPVFIVDNDSIAGGTPVVSARDAIVDEATSGYARFVVTLDRPATAITTVQYQVTGGTAQAGQDFLA